MSNYDTLADGEYVMKIVNAEFKVSGSGKEMFVYSLEVEEGDRAGEPCEKTAWLTPKAVPYTLKELGKLGIRGKGVAEAKERVSQAVGAIVRVVRKTTPKADGGEWINYYFNDLIKEPAVPMIKNAFADDDIPF